MTSSVRKIKATRIGSAFSRTSVETYKQKQAPYRGENFGATGTFVIEDEASDPSRWEY